MRTENPFNIPSLVEVFGEDKVLLNALRSIGFTSTPAVMLMPTEALRGLPGMSARRIRKVTAALKARKLAHRSFNQSIGAFIIKQFGCIEDAPIGVLQITIVREGKVNYPRLAPLEIVSLLEDIESRTTVIDIMKMTKSELRIAVQQAAAFGLEVHNLDEDIKHLTIRMGNHDVGLHPEPERFLRAVV